jgi:IS1 family transposase
MRILSREKRILIVNLLVEGNSINGTTRLAGVSKHTVLRLLLDIARVCCQHEDANVRGLRCRSIECDELWGFSGCKDRNVDRARIEDEHLGSVWTWYGVCADSKMIVGWTMGDRGREQAASLMDDIASRCSDIGQINTDALNLYVGAINAAFHDRPDVGHGQIHKEYGQVSTTDERRYSPAQCIGCTRLAVRGNPDPFAVSTSYIERSNLSVRTFQKRWTRLTLCHSKKFQYMQAAFALHACWFNWCRKHAAHGKTPAQAAGLTDRKWTIGDLVDLLAKDEADRVAAGSLKRGPYKPRKSAI